MAREQGSPPDELQAALLAAPWDAELAQRVEALDASERERLVDGFKAALDRLQRSAPENALERSGSLLELAIRVPTRAALCARGRGVALHAAGRFLEAAAAYRRAAALYAAAGEELDRLRMQRNLVDALQMTGQAEAALAVGAEAREALQVRGEWALLAQLECNLGNVYFRLERYQEAEFHYRSAVEAFDRLGDTKAAAFARYNLANVETNAGDFETAELHFEAAEAAFRAAGLAVLEADCRYGKAYLLLRRGRYVEAQRGLEASLHEFRALGKPGGPALCALDLAELFLKLDADRDALDRALSAAGEFAGAGMAAEQARALYFAATALARLERFGEASKALEQARELWRTLGNRTASALLDLELARIAAPSGTPRDFVMAAAAVLASSGDRLLADLGRLAVCRELFECGRHGEAERAIEQLLADAGGGAGLLDLVAIEGLTLAAECALARGERETAERRLEAAIAQVERTYASLAGGDARLAYFRRRHASYARLAILRLYRGAAPHQAIVVLERGRQRSLVERRDLPVSAELSEARARLDQVLSAALDRRLEAGRMGELRRLNADPQDRTLGELEERVSRLARQGTRQPVASAVQLEMAPLEAIVGERYLAYFLADGQELWCISGRPGALHARRLELTLKQVLELGAQLRYQLGKAALGADYLERHRTALLRGFSRTAGELGEGLLGAATEHLPAGETLWVVPYGPLHDLPFAALEVRGQPLVRRGPIGVVRSLRQMARVAGPERLDGPVWLCGARESGLPGVQAELEALARLYGQRALVLEPEQLFERLDRGDLADLAVLHLAAHGSFLPDQPLFSGLRLGERFLTAFDLASKRFPGCLVTLSGCETGRSRRSISDELTGPEQALLGAGARAVVSSLWAVEDRIAAELMVHLHTQLQSGERLDLALARSQLALAKQEPHPFGWAAFQVVGWSELRLI